MVIKRDPTGGRGLSADEDGRILAELRHLLLPRGNRQPYMPAHRHRKPPEGGGKTRGAQPPPVTALTRFLRRSGSSLRSLPAPACVPVLPAAARACLPQLLPDGPDPTSPDSLDTATGFSRGGVSAPLPPVLPDSPDLVPCTQQAEEDHVEAAAILQVLTPSPLQSTERPLARSPGISVVTTADLIPHSYLTTAAALCEDVIYTSRPPATMPPKSQRPPPSLRKQPVTPLTKKLPWPDPPEEDRVALLPSPRRETQDGSWDPSSDSVSEGSEDGAACPRGERKWTRFLRRLPTKEDFQSLVAEVKETCKKEITAIRQDLKHVADRVETLEGDHDETRQYVSQLQTHISAQEKLLYDTRLHLEDLDNRGRRNNIRVRGLKEADTTEDLPAALESIFNILLDKPSDHKIVLDRAHRALRPKPPRDIICRVHDFGLKEQIMTAARARREIHFADSAIQLFPDLAWVTLQRRRHLRPLISLLRARNIPYRWGFPFSLTATLNGKSAVLRCPADLPAFCSHLDVDQPPLPDWELSLTPTAPKPAWHRVHHKRRRPPSQGSPRSTPGQRSPAIS